MFAEILDGELLAFPPPGSATRERLRRSAAIFSIASSSAGRGRYARRMVDSGVKPGGGGSEFPFFPMLSSWTPRRTGGVRSSRRARRPSTAERRFGSTLGRKSPLWLVNPIARILEVYRLAEGHWVFAPDFLGRRSRKSGAFRSRGVLDGDAPGSQKRRAGGTSGGAAGYAGPKALTIEGQSERSRKRNEIKTS
jgi:hypothetical protein